MKRLLTAAVAATVLLLAGCGGKTDTPKATSLGTPSASTSPAAFPVTVGTLKLAQRPEKIVSLAPTDTEILFAIGAGSQVTAADDQSDYPADAPKSTLSGYKPNAEAIAAKNPDLVVLSYDTDQIVEQLGKLKIPTFVTPAAVSMDDTYKQIGELGALTGHTPEAEALHQQMVSKINAIVQKVAADPKPVSYYYELDPTLYTATSKTFIGSIFSMFNMTNVADPADADGKAAGYPQLSQEALVKANPATIFLADSKCCGQSPATVSARKGWAGITAVQKKQIFALDDDIASRWGPRTVDLVQAIADDLAKVSA